MLLVRAETNWVFVGAKSGSPLAIPPLVAEVMPVFPDRSLE